MNTGFAGDGKFAIARRASAVSALEFAPGAKNSEARGKNSLTILRNITNHFTHSE